MNNFPDRISELVNESGKTLTEISSDLGIAKQTLSAWCTGQRKPKTITLAHVADYFRTSVSWLQGIDNNKRPVDYKDLNGIAMLKETFNNRLVFVATNNNAHVCIDIRFGDDQIITTINGQHGDLAEAFFLLDANGKKNVLLDMLKRYC